MTHTTPIDAPTVKQFRHRAEVPMLVLGLVLSLGISASAIYFILAGQTLSSFAQGVLAGLVAPVFGAVFIRYHYWTTISNAVEVTDKQFPEIYAIYRQLALDMGFSEDGKGIRKTPRLYIRNGNGAMNAFAAKCEIRRGYVVLFSDLVDIAYSHGEFDTLRFVLAHELGHIKCGHVDLWRIMITPVTTALFIDKTVTRAQEYTADRVASYYAPGDYKGMIYLYAGKNLGNQIDLDEYFNSIDNHKDGLWIRVSNFMSSHAVGFRRMKALLETEHKGWDVHGRML